MVEAVEEQHAVGQPGERVVERLVQQQLLGALAHEELADLHAERRREAGELVVDPPRPVERELEDAERVGPVHDGDDDAGARHHRRAPPAAAGRPAAGRAATRPHDAARRRLVEQPQAATLPLELAHDGLDQCRQRLAQRRPARHDPRRAVQAERRRSAQPLLGDVAHERQAAGLPRRSASIIARSAPQRTSPLGRT